MPIEIVARPAEDQSVRQGDIVNLTVVATSDNLYPVTYKLSLIHISEPTRRS